ncbi:MULTISPECIES: hypothetical protein [Ralstonia]|jgi:hypothetical protein|uniref:Uncharacterized protein n=2 Tax=Ralstonia pickettii TaxID=329 RepID=A0ABN9I7H5_RALPI|nr:MULTISPECIES: hypothetical protein [Ralstonia]CAJ0727679.1 hypothetical protein R38712_03454 [Ralstonia pickettii]
MRTTLRQPLIFAGHSAAVKDALAHRYPDVMRMKSCLRAAGYEVADADLAAAWISHSSSESTDWSAAPDEEGALLAILLQGETPLLISPGALHHWRTTVLDTDDGSGDQIVPLPDELMSAMGWSIGDALEIGATAAGDVRLRKVT